MSYWANTRAPRYSIVFAVPLLLLYEGLAWAMGRTGVSQVRNGADVLLKNLFLALGGRYGLSVFAGVLLLVGLYLVGRDVRKNGAPVARTYLGMAGESILYAALLGIVASALTSILLTGRLAMVQGGPADSFPLPVQLMVSLGAGLYEELVFRVLLVSGLAAIGAKVFGWKPVPAGIVAAVLGALIFSAFHYIGPYGDPFRVGSFTFRAIAGLLFSTLYLTRGFGITAWSHALYDVFLAL
jgi:energy-converting hydrogenase Eha subunit A